MKVTCLHRVLGECKECLINYNLNHHPNNYDCEKYYEIHIIETEIKEKVFIFLSKKTNGEK